MSDLTTLAAVEAVGRTIEIARCNDDALTLVFVDGSQLQLTDTGQDCCEKRYMTCGDDLQSFTGDKYLGWETLDAPSPADMNDGECHDIMFLHVRTSGGTITCETHNEHNGYYGGFSVTASLVELP